MKVNNKDLIQSYIITSAKYDYSVYEKRILYRLIELFQSLTKGCKPYLSAQAILCRPLKILHILR